jgi:hypothetical protein
LNSFFIPSATAVDYNLELTKDKELIWKVNEYDEDIYNNIFLKDADFDKDDQQKLKISNIDTREKKWVITYLIWDYTDNTQDFSNPADDEKYKTVYKDPEDQGDDIIELEDIVKMWVVPSPFNGYIEEFRDEFDNPIIDIAVEEDTLIAKYDIETSQYEIQITYANDGLAEKIEYIDDDGETFVELSLLKEVIPGYPLFFIIILICGVISIIMWRIKFVLKIH